MMLKRTRYAWLGRKNAKVSSVAKDLSESSLLLIVVALNAITALGEGRESGYEVVCVELQLVRYWVCC